MPAGLFVQAGEHLWVRQIARSCPQGFSLTLLQSTVLWVLGLAADNPETLATHSLLGTWLDSRYLAAHVDQTCCTCRPRIDRKAFCAHVQKGLLAKELYLYGQMYSKSLQVSPSICFLKQLGCSASAHVQYWMTVHSQTACFANKSAAINFFHEIAYDSNSATAHYEKIFRAPTSHVSPICQHVITQ